MKKNKIQITLSIFLLALMLAGRVGIHIFHHHEAGLFSGKKQASGISILTSHENEADCALCKLDTFQALSIESLVVFAFFLVILKPVDRFLLATFSVLTFFTKSRGPPSSFLIA